MDAFLCHHKSRQIMNKNNVPLDRVKVLYGLLINCNSEKYEGKD